MDHKNYSYTSGLIELIECGVLSATLKSPPNQKSLSKSTKSKVKNNFALKIDASKNKNLFAANQLYKEKEKIIAWLELIKIKNYSLIEDKTYGYTVDVASTVDMSKEKITHLKVKFNVVTEDFVLGPEIITLNGCPTHVKGSFVCVGASNLTSLKGSPSIVDNHFTCAKCALTSLIDGPREVGGFFVCSGNNLTTLIGGPKKVSNYYCNANQLTTLKGIASIIKGDLYFAQNHITSLKHCPEKIVGSLIGYQNLINNLKYAPQFVGGVVSLRDNEFEDCHKINTFNDMLELSIKEQKKQLNSELQSAPRKLKLKTLKI